MDWGKIIDDGFAHDKPMVQILEEVYQMGRRDAEADLKEKTEK